MRTNRKSLLHENRVYAKIRFCFLYALRLLSYTVSAVYIFDACADYPNQIRVYPMFDLGNLIYQLLQYHISLEICCRSLVILFVDDLL